MIHPPPEPRREPEPTIPGLPTDLRLWAREVVQIVLVTALLFLVVNTFVAQPFEVQQRSMQPALASGDHILIDKLSIRWSPYSRGDVVVFHAPGEYDAGGIPYVKRIIGMPGDTIQIENGRIFVTPAGGVANRLDEPYLAAGEASLPQGADGRREWNVPDNAYFVLGDNRSESVDSRTFGAIPHDRIVGRALLRYLPIDRMGTIGTDEG